MQITIGTIVSIDYTLTNDAGEVLDTSRGGSPLVYLHGGGGLIVGMEKGLEGRSVGESFKLVVEPHEGYGVRREELVQAVPRTMFAPAAELEVGMQFQAKTGQGPQTVKVIDVADAAVTVDANHELAGVRLHFDVTVVDVRAATPTEIADGHAH